MLMLDSEFARELLRVDNISVRDCARDLSTRDMPYIFRDVLAKYGRAVIAVTCALSLPVDSEYSSWGREVLKRYTGSKWVIDNDLNPIRLEECISELVRMTIVG